MSIKRLLSVITGVLLLLTILIAAPVSANTGWVDFGFYSLGEFLAVNYTTPVPVDLLIEMEETDGLADDEIHILIDDIMVGNYTSNNCCNISVNVSLCPGDYEIKFLFAGTWINPVFGGRYRLTENAFTGDYVIPGLPLPCAEPVPPPVGGDVLPVNKFGLIAPWVAVVVLVGGGISWYFLRRRRA